MAAEFTEEEKSRIFAICAHQKWALFEPGGNYLPVSMRRGEKLEGRIVKHLKQIGIGEISPWDTICYSCLVVTVRASYNGSSYDSHLRALTVGIPAPSIEPAYNPVVDVWLQSFDAPPIPTDLSQQKVICVTGSVHQRKILTDGLCRLFDNHPAAIQIGAFPGQLNYSSGSLEIDNPKATLTVLNRTAPGSAKISSTTLALYDQLSDEDRSALHDPEIVAAHLRWRHEC